MDAPTCRLCGPAHYASEPHKFNKAPGPAKPARKKKSKKTSAVISGAAVEEMVAATPTGGIDLSLAIAAAPEIEIFEQLFARIESLEERVLQLEARKKYQRDLMRKRREEGKA